MTDPTFRATDTGGHEVAASSAYRTGNRTRVVERNAPARADIVRWGPIWAGFLVALAVYLTLELIFFAFGWLTLDQGEPGSTAGWISAILGLVAFFVGGLIAAATSRWRDVADGVLQGIMVWVLGLATFLFLGVFGAGGLLGGLGNFIARSIAIRQSDLPSVDLQPLLTSARDAAGWAAVGLGVSVVAAAVGGMVGARLTPPADDDREIYLSDSGDATRR